MTNRAFQGLALGVSLAGTLILVALILMRTHGVLIYTLDDPYIHLALAEEILRGGYGINPGEVASPSSSILYAPLLAPLLALGFGTWAPLTASAMGQAAVIWGLAGCVAPFVARRLWLAVPAALLLPLSVNAYALPLTGMEHPLHAAASVLVILGLWRAAQGRAPGWLVPALLLAAAFRFEGYALALAAILVLLALRHTRTALVAVLGLGALTLAYGLAMQHLGLPFLPSSVMVKSQVSAAAAEADLGNTISSLLVNLIRAVSNRWGLIFACFTLIFAALALSRRATRPVRAVAFAAFSTLAAHLLVGRYGWFGRYEVYAVATLLAATLLILPRQSRSAPALVLALLAGLGWGYLPVTRQTPAAAQSVFEQHYQMHRFATEFFPYPVAVNDLGWVAYDNNIRVLDLWGLGSEIARQVTRHGGRTADTLRALTEGVRYAMIYDIAFADAIPPEWCRIAQLTTSRVIAASDEVAVYLIDRSQEDSLRTALAAFEPGLPPGARLTLSECEP